MLQKGKARTIRWGVCIVDVLFRIGIVLLAGLVGAKLARMLRLPNVTGYLVAGLLIGQSFLGFVSTEDVDSFGIISEMALAIIAFSIGSEFVFEDMRKRGKPILVITLFEVLGAVTLVFTVMYFGLRQPFAFSIVIAAMSASTAPAATLLVIRQYRADGPLTQAVLPVVALDDVFGIMAFGVAASVARLTLGSSESSLLQMLVRPVGEIAGSLSLGAVLGVLLSLAAKGAGDRDELQGISIGAILVAVGLANRLHLSPLLTCIMMGTVLANLMRSAARVFGSVNDFAPPLYVLFFALAGASLDLGILSQVGILGIAYIAARAAGKMLGAAVGARAVNSDEKVARYLGLALLPQGGVAIGLTVLVRQIVPEYAPAITTIVMFGVLVYEVLGPIAAKMAIAKAGEINGRESAHDKQNIPIVEELVF